MSEQRQKQRTARAWTLSLTAAAALCLAACGSDTTSGTTATSDARGTLLHDPPFRIASVDAATFNGQLAATASGAQLLQLAGTPTCGVDFYYIQYNTVDGTGKPTTASGALMVPTGAAAPVQRRAAHRAIRPWHQHRPRPQHRRYHQSQQHRGCADRRDVRRAGIISWSRPITPATTAPRWTITRT